MPLGIEEGTEYVDERFELYHGDVVVLMTDGVLEALEPDLMTMGTLQQLLAETPDGAEGVHSVLLRRFDDCTVGGRPDDMTLMALEAMPEPIAGSFLDFARAS
jgi:serine phosphatase RsbU (regulator of sigma subunit)